MWMVWNVPYHKKDQKYHNISRDLSVKKIDDARSNKYIFHP
jgi:hypothetical protein